MAEKGRLELIDDLSDDRQQLAQSITVNIDSNGNNAITGDILQQELLNISNTIIERLGVLGEVIDSFYNRTDDTTDIVTEGLTNLYWTLQRFDDALTAKSTTDLAEGTNLYHTTTRVDDIIATKTTTDITEGTNLYHTPARVSTIITTDRPIAGTVTPAVSDLGNGGNTGTAGTTLSAIADTSTSNQAAFIMNDLRSLRDQINDLKQVQNNILARLQTSNTITA